MYQAVEAVCRAGQIVPIESVQFEENEHLVIVRIPSTRRLPGTVTPAVPDWQSLIGVLKNSPNWNDDPQAIQEDMRREWA